MFFRGTLLAALAVPIIAQADAVDSIVNDQILPGYTAFAAQTEALKTAAQTCDDTTIRLAYHATFDAWMGVSHLRFGPSEQDERAFSIAFWPDTKGFTPKTLHRLITDMDHAVVSPEAFGQVSIAGRGLFALEYLLFDPALSTPSDYRCALMQAVATDLDGKADAILHDWQNGYAQALTQPSAPYRTPEEALREMMTALSGGLQVTSDLRLGRPLGTFDRPRPRRAEAWRSERSLRNLALSVEALEPLAMTLVNAQPDPEVRANMASAFERAKFVIADLQDPTLAGVSTVGGRLRVDVIRTAIERIRELVQTELAQALGVGEGFNALDGD